MNASIPPASYDSARSGRYDPLLFRYAVVWSALTLCNLFAGGSVTSHEAGLAVPDWPTTYGHNMFTYPPSRWVGGILFEHGHRLIASTVGLLTIGMVVLITLRDPRRWMRRLSYLALGAVIAQGALGGLTVLYFLPPPVSIAHAGLAQLFFCLTAAMTLFLSRGWRERSAGRIEFGGVGLRRLCAAATALIYLQVLLGAVVRHTKSGLAITDFPKSYGQWIPPLDPASIDRINQERRWSENYDRLPVITAGQIGLHFAHRVNALVVTAVVVATALTALRQARGCAGLRGPSGMLLALLAGQLTLGALTIWTLRNPWINTAHVAVGAALLATSLVLALRVRRATVPIPLRQVAASPVAAEGAPA